MFLCRKESLVFYLLAGNIFWAEGQPPLLEKLVVPCDQRPFCSWYWNPFFIVERSHLSRSSKINFGEFLEKSVKLLERQSHPFEQKLEGSPPLCLSGSPIIWEYIRNMEDKWPNTVISLSPSYTYQQQQSQLLEQGFYGWRYCCHSCPANRHPSWFGVPSWRHNGDIHNSR